MVKALVKLHKSKGKKSIEKNQRNLSIYLLPYVASIVHQAIKKNRYKRNPNMYEISGTIVLDTQKNVYFCMCDKNFVGNSIKFYLFSRIRITSNFPLCFDRFNRISLFILRINTNKNKQTQFQTSLRQHEFECFEKLRAIFRFDFNYQNTVGFSLKFKF